MYCFTLCRLVNVVEALEVHDGQIDKVQDKAGLIGLIAEKKREFLQELRGMTIDTLHGKATETASVAGAAVAVAAVEARQRVNAADERLAEVVHERSSLQERRASFDGFADT